MTEKETKEIEEPEIEFVKATKILDKAIEKMQKETKNFEQKEFIEKADTQLADSINKELQIKEFETYFDLIFTFLFTMINPMLKKEKIEPISKEEIQELKDAIIGYITDKILGKDTQKITQFFAKIVDIPKLIRLIVSIWKIIFPRLTTFFESRNKPIDETINLGDLE